MNHQMKKDPQVLMKKYTTNINLKHIQRYLLKNDPTLWKRNIRFEYIDIYEKVSTDMNLKKIPKILSKNIHKYQQKSEIMNNTLFSS